MPRISQSHLLLIAEFAITSYFSEEKHEKEFEAPMYLEAIKCHELMVSLLG